MMLDHNAMMLSVVTMLRQGRKIEAIKQYRMMTGVGLKEAKDACEALGEVVKTPKPEPMAGRVTIVDSANPRRVLGTMKRPALSSHTHDRFCIATMGPVRSPWAEPGFDTTPLSTSRIDFSLRAVGFDVVATTDADLKQLALIDGFRFPGECEDAARVRVNYWG